MSHDAPNETTKHGCIIMASGLGTRFGGNKLMADLGGMPLIQHVIAASEGLFSKRVVVTRSADVADLCSALGVEFVLHEEPHRNDTVRLGMEAMDGCQTVTFLQGDQPLVTPETIAALLRSAESDPGSLWRVAYQGTPGAPVLFPRWTFQELRHLPPSKGGGFVAKSHKDRVGTVEAASPWELQDVDTREDLEALRQLLP